ncbi:MAG: histidine triad protein, partial [Pseudomonadota bacterium]
AAFGNMVSQLHVHIIARHKTDPLWPENVVGAKQADAYRDHQPPDWWSSFLERLARKDLNKP